MEAVQAFFAAVRAARLGLWVALVEQQAILGGMATTVQITHWNSTLRSMDDKKIIGRLLVEVTYRLRSRDALIEIPT